MQGGSEEHRLTVI